MRSWGSSSHITFSLQARTFLCARARAVATPYAQTKSRPHATLHDRADNRSPSDTFAIKFTLDEPLPRPDNRLVPSVFKSGCFDYKARPSDYVAKVASIFGVRFVVSAAL